MIVRKILRLSLSVLFFTLTQLVYSQEIILENGLMRLVISPQGYAKSLVSKTTGEECLDTSSTLPLCTITQYRPYDNENFLMYPAKPKVFPSNEIKYSDGKLYVKFENTFDIFNIDVKIKDDYIAFKLDEIDYVVESVGVKRKTEIDELAFIQLPILHRENFGEWLNVMWDGETAICLLATDIRTRIDGFPNPQYMNMYAGADFQVGLSDVSAALIVSPKEELLPCIAKVEEDYDMPRGVDSRNHEAYLCSYYELRDVTKDNIDEHITNAKKGGFKSIVIYYPDFAWTCGHFLWNPYRYPNGIEDLKEVTAKIHEAGMILGFHIHYSKVSMDDPYVCSGIPDSRLNWVKDLILSKPVSATDDVFYVEGNPEGMHTEDGRRIVQIGNELVSYESFTTEPPYTIQGCTRGIHNTTAVAHQKGTHFRLLDVDTWPRFIRVNQNTTIQKEIAENLAKIYNEAGFQFIYFDGAEDVPNPYWYNVSLSQKIVYDELDPVPLFNEGALKSHYGWHILTRGNAFDHFKPEKVRYAMQKYVLPCAERISKDFTSVNFGWVDYLAPDSLSIGMQPDMYEYICSKALAWDAPISLVAKLDQMRIHPRNDDLLEVINRWETLKLTKTLSQEEKDRLKDSQKEFLLLNDRAGKPEILEYESITSYEERPVRAFAFERNGKNCLIYWSVDGEGEIELATYAKIKLYDTDGKRVRYKYKNGKFTLPLGKRLIIETDLDKDVLIEIFRKSVGY